MCAGGCCPAERVAEAAPRTSPKLARQGRRWLDHTVSVEILIDVGHQGLGDPKPRRHIRAIAGLLSDHRHAQPTRMAVAYHPACEFRSYLGSTCRNTNHARRREGSV